MATTKISQLPTWTGTSAVSRFFVMNNPDENETFKFSGFTSQVIPGTGTNSLVSPEIPRANAPNPFDMLIGGSGNTITNATKFNSIIGGEDNTITANRAEGLNTIVGSYDSTIGPNQGGLASGIFSSYNSTLNRGGYGSVIIGGYNNTFTDINAWGSAMIGGESNTKNFGKASFMAGGSFNETSGQRSFVIGGFQNSANDANAGGILGGENNTLNGGNDAALVMIGGLSNTLNNNGGIGTTILGGQSNFIRSFDGTIGDGRDCNGAILGGKLNRIEGNTTASSGAHFLPLILGGKENKIFGELSDSTTTSASTIINSFTSTIKDSLLCAHIESSGSTISGMTSAVMIGTNNRTASTDNATFVENLVVFNYAALDFVDDAAAATGGVVLGQIYHDAGAMRIRVV